MIIWQLKDRFQDQTKQISVWKHKTTGAYGSAVITVDYFIYKWLGVYIKYFFPCAERAVDNVEHDDT